MGVFKKTHVTRKRGRRRREVKPRLLPPRTLRARREYKFTLPNKNYQVHTCQYYHSISLSSLKLGHFHRYPSLSRFHFFPPILFLLKLSLSPPPSLCSVERHPLLPLPLWIEFPTRKNLRKSSKSIIFSGFNSLSLFGK